MRITKKMAKDLIDILDEVREDVFKDRKFEYPFTEWERKREKVKERLRNLPDYIEKAVDMIEIGEKTGKPKSLNLVQRTMLFLFARLMNKSNRDVEDLLEMFEPLFGFKTSYKSVERLYSDEEVKLVLHNLFILLLQNEGTSGNFSGDGTGYSLSVEKHYRKDPKKKGKDYRYVFMMIDLDTGMYVGYGYSNRSEMDAFKKAVELVRRLGVRVDSVALDKYYSSRKIIKLLGKDVAVYVIPKKNLSRLGFEWVRVIKRIAKCPVKFLSRYFMRNLSEAGFSADKRRFGHIIRQRREDRREMAMFSISLMHNLFVVRVRPA